jgi:two-component system, cell cycle response regulator
MEDMPIKIEKHEYEDLVLIVDDVEENTILLKRIFANDGYKVVSINDSSKAFNVARTFTPSLIILDIQMPGLDGFDVCKILKNDPITRSIPVIFISALESTVDRLRGFEAGAVDYIVKPIEIDETRARVKSHITIRRLQQQLEKVNTTLDINVAKLTVTQNQLSERERRLNALINALPTLTFVYNQKGNYLEVMGNNPDLFVMEPSKMIGKNVTEILPPDVAALFIQSIQAVLQTNQTKIIEYQLKLRNVKSLWFEGRLAVLEQDSDGGGKVICVTSEITERVELFKLVEHMAIQDPLTNCFNRRHFLTQAESEISRGLRFSRPASLLMIDIDHFKRVNDRYGHPVGDQVLIGVVNIIRKSIRALDILGRYGGEEFILLLPETDTSGALVVAEKLRRTIEMSGIPTNQGIIPITISVGISCLDQEKGRKNSTEAFISEADEALYLAKMNGRNQVRVNNHLIPENASVDVVIRKQ